MNIFARKEAAPIIKHTKQEHSPNCCGADFISWFPQPQVEEYDDDDQPIVAKIDTKILENVEQELELHLKKSANSMMLILLNNHQKKFYDKMIKDAGFRTLMTDVYHPAHGNHLTLYGWKKYKGENDPKAELYDEDYD